MSVAIELLQSLVGYNTCNPGGDEIALTRFLAQQLAHHKPDLLDVVMLPNNAYVLALFGEPKLLINVHLDTVPINNGWVSSPHAAVVSDNKLYGLGAADTKGAIAALLAACLEIAPRHVAILFSGDEENQGRCMRHFIQHRIQSGSLKIERAIVCEPTFCKVGTRHRGILALRAVAEGQGGHSSYADTLPAPLVDLAKLAVALHAWGEQQRDKGPEHFRGSCMNVARFEGGVAFNVVPQKAALEFSLRPPPGSDNNAILEELKTLVAPHIRLETVLNFPSFATRDLPAYSPYLDIAQTCNLGFWTEAALLAAEGIDAVVLGPGNIAQAHAPNEYVELSQLMQAQQIFMRVLNATR
jgi:acetylornithine deacetylase